ncbi:MAG: serine hydrolase domain-containing protein, partial [Steroidobacteraceae bacterium]
MSDATRSATLSPARLAALRRAIEDDIRQRRYHGAVIAVARNGVLGLHTSIGHADEGALRPLRLDSVFSIFSVTKAFTNALVFRAIEQGRVALTTRVCAVIPEFSGGLREQITFYHLLTHSSGLPPVFSPIPGQDAYIDRLDEVVAAICEHVHTDMPPNERVTYALLVAHALMGEAVRRTDPQGRSFRQLLDEEIFTPLRMHDTAAGVRADLEARHVVPHFLTPMPFKHLSHRVPGPNGAFEDELAEMPWVGCVSTVADLFRFAEMLRRSGELDGVRILSPAMLEQATINRTGDKPNELYAELARSRGWAPYPAYIGIGFSLRGEAICPHQFGTLTSPRTYGHQGAGSALFWVDPAREVTFVALTAGVMDEAD